MLELKRLNYEDALIQVSHEVLNYLLKTGISREDAQDVIQDTFVKMIETDLDLPYKQTRAWMYRVAIRTYIDRYRRKQRYQELLELHFKEPLYWEFPNLPDRDLYNGLEKLKLEDVSLLIMRYEQELSIKDIAQIFDVSPNKIKTDLFRTRQRLKKILLDGDEKNGKFT